MQKYFKLSAYVFFIFLLGGCGLKKEFVISGKTMGTTYRINIVTGYFKNVVILKEKLKEKIDKRLQEINKSMSTFLKDSEISRFNSSHLIGKKKYISKDFWNVMLVAENLYNITDGAWDGTIEPLVSLWGFGSKETKGRIPEKEEIEAHLTEIGFNLIEISRNNRCLAKKKASITLDLASIAKGYGVDQISALLRKNGIDNFLVEIGGEIYASGFRKDNKKWRVGINMPKKDAPYDQVYKITTLHNEALATSGVYRNFFEVGNGRLYSHIIDPKTGYPVINGVVSVSIIAENCTFADGLATAILVMGRKKGIELVNRLDNVECTIVVKNKDGSLTGYYSRGFNQT